MTCEVRKQHRWLQQFVGEWTMEMEAMCEPGKPPMKSTGKEHVRTLGDVWIVGEGESTMPDGNIGRMMLTLGYDPVAGQFVGTWVGSMMTHMWRYAGTLDAAERVLTLDTEGPSFADPKVLTRYQDIYEIISPDHRTLSSQTMGEDGKWMRFMTAHYRRVK